MPLGERPLCMRCHHDREREALGERDGFAGCTARAVAEDEERTFGSEQELGRRATRRRVGERRRSDGRRDDGGLERGRLRHVVRNVEEDGPRTSGRRGGPRACSRARGDGRRVDGTGPPRDPAHQRDDVEPEVRPVLERASASPAGRDVAADHDDRNLFCLCARDGRQRVGDAGPRRDQDERGPSRDPRVTERGEHRGRLVSRRHELDLGYVGERVEHGSDGASWNSERCADAVVSKAPQQLRRRADTGPCDETDVRRNRGELCHAACLPRPTCIERGRAGQLIRGHLSSRNGAAAIECATDRCNRRIAPPRRFREARTRSTRLRRRRGERSRARCTRSPSPS